MERYAAVLSTAGSKEEAQRLARGLVEAKLAACVQLLPIESFYVWNDKIQNDAEILLLVKTRRSSFAAIRAYMKRNHAYDTPELICLDVVEGEQAYLDWIGANTLPAGEGS